MPGLTEQDKAELANLSDDEKAVLAAFEAQNSPGEDPDEHAEGTGTGTDDGVPAGASGESKDEPGDAAGGAGGTETPEAGTKPDEDLVEIKSIKIGDREVPIEDVQALLDFQTWSQQNPDKMRAFGQYLSGEAEFVQRQKEQEGPKPDEQIDWDMVDPAVKKAYEQQQASIAELNQRFEQQQAPIQQWQQQQMEDVQRQATDQITKATEQIQEKLSLDLTPEEVDDLHNTAASLNILPGLRQSIADPVEAVATALEMAIYKTPKFRDKIIEGQVATERAKDKRHLASMVTGTSGSDRSGLQSPASESDVKKMSPQAKQQAMAAEIAESMRGTV